MTTACSAKLQVDRGRVDMNQSSNEILACCRLGNRLRHSTSD